MKAAVKNVIVIEKRFSKKKKMIRLCLRFLISYTHIYTQHHNLSTPEVESEPSLSHYPWEEVSLETAEWTCNPNFIQQTRSEETILFFFLICTEFLKFFFSFRGIIRVLFLLQRPVFENLFSRLVIHNSETYTMIILLYFCYL